MAARLGRKPGEMSALMDSGNVPAPQYLTSGSLIRMPSPMGTVPPPKSLSALPSKSGRCTRRPALNGARTSLPCATPWMGYPARQPELPRGDLRHFLRVNGTDSILRWSTSSGPGCPYLWCGPTHCSCAVSEPTHGTGGHQRMALPLLLLPRPTLSRPQPYPLSDLPLPAPTTNN